jgi:hypothetical protein
MTAVRRPDIEGDVFDRLRGAPGERLDADRYLAAFESDFARAEHGVWKLERAQEFYEPDVESWRALFDGDWVRALALAEGMREPLTDFYARHPPCRRIRIVERPVTPYLQWELHVLAIRASAGERIRVLPADSIRHVEHAALLPELLALSPTLLYQVCYDEIGAHTGGRRITDPAVAAPCLDAVVALYEQGEELLPYFEREIATLPPPVITAEARERFPDHSSHTESFRP